MNGDDTSSRLPTPQVVVAGLVPVVINYDHKHLKALLT